MANDLWEPLPPGADLGTVPLGVSEAESKRAEGAPASGALGATSAANAGAPSSPDDFDAKLREAVIRLRWQQPEEFDVFSRMAQIEKQLADVLAIVELQTEVILRLSHKAAV